MSTSCRWPVQEGGLRHLPTQTREAQAERTRALLHELADILADHLTEREPVSPHDQLIEVEEAAAIMKISTDTLYSRPFPFKVYIGDRVLFSRVGIDQWIRSQAGKPRR